MTYSTWTKLALRLRIAELEEEVAALKLSYQQAIQRDEAQSTQYRELILSVVRKYPGETRHETALRYIRQAEHSAISPMDAGVTENKT